MHALLVGIHLSLIV